MPDYTPNFAGVIDALKTIIQVGIAGGGGGGNAGSASAENQQTEITRLTEVRDRFPINLVSDRLKVDLPITAATDASLQQIITNLPSSTKPSLIRSVSRKYKDDFSGTTLSNDWQILQTGAGQSIAVTNSELRISTGITANSETIIRNIIPFTIPFRVIIPFYLTQRIANQEFYIEFVDATGDDKISIQFLGTSSSTANITCSTGGSTLGVFTNANFSTAGYSQAIELEVASDEINLYPRLINSASSRGTNTVVNRRIPNPNLEYFLQIRTKNLSSSPASSTNFILDSILIQDIEEITAEITAGRGGGGVNQAVPVILATSPNVNVTNTSLLSRLFTNNALFTNSILAANATYTSSGFFSPERLKGWIVTDQPGTLILESSRDNSTWRQPTASVPISAGTTAINFECLGYYSRLKYINGVTAQSSFELALMSIG